MVNSRLGLVTATLLRGHPFSRSYGAILPSSLERVISRPLVCSTHLPVSVSGTGYFRLYDSASFSRKFDEIGRHTYWMGLYEPLQYNAESRLGSGKVFLPSLSHLERVRQIRWRFPLDFFVPWYRSKISTGILTCLPSTTPFGLILGPDSPSLDEPTEGTLRLSGHWILTNVCVTQADILTSAPSTPIYIDASPKAERSPTDIDRVDVPQLRQTA